MDIRITKYCHIRGNVIELNGERVFENPDAANFGEFIRSAYKFAGVAYPKFYKMDDLCKAAFVAAEILLKGTQVIEHYGKDRIGIMLQNSSSTIDTDTEFQRTIDDRSNYFPSPAVFVYTLPNIMIGEICIRHKLFGENALFIEKAFEPEQLIRYSGLLFSQQRMSACIAGRVEQNGDDYEAFLYLAESKETQNSEQWMPHDAAHLRKIYQQSL